ncbi:hypothetical protein ACFLS1_04700 [Verrucomicrobiota bacterium]
MNNNKRSPDFGRWAITGVITPIVVILILRFAIAPFFWPDLAASLGASLGYIFIWWLLIVAIVATIYKIRKEQKE